MVWFQCESCGENLKKPKLQNHFRGCAARKLSCIDCGVIFDQQSVQAHTSCVTETEKYGPKGANKVSNGSAQKPKNAHSQKSADIDLSLGLSTHPPWFCSLCNVSATSCETLEGHSQGKKHRAKAKAAQTKLNPPPAPTEQSVPTATNGSTPDETAEIKGEPGHGENGASVPSSDIVVVIKKEKSGKKRKGVAAENGVANDLETSNGVNESAEPDSKKKGKKGKSGAAKDAEVAKNVRKPTKAVKWKKLITKVLSQAPDGVMKTKKLVKEVLPLVDETGADGALDKKALEAQLWEKLSTCSKFEVDRKVVRLGKSS